ncbi:hypothetical protein DFP73DRAFT_567218 [Morchella snyderi]|nr:hypothetical protein DFP73DRAFT_567218 [Morchella snyderi]
MTLGCDTAAVLMSALDLLRHQTSPAQHALLTPDERRSSLHQLTVAVEAAAKLAEVAHVEAIAVAAQHNAAGVDADRIRAEAERFRAEAARFGKEAEKVMAETERTRAEAEKARSETERQAAATAAAAACIKPLETSGVTPSPALAVQTRLCTSSSPPVSASPDVLNITITGLFAGNSKVREIEDAWGRWDGMGIEEYTSAGWAWFKHSATEAFIFLNVPGGGRMSANKRIGNRTGTINVPSAMLKNLDKQRGYDELIYGRRRENGKRDSVLIV